MADIAGFHTVHTHPCLGPRNLTFILLLSRDRFADGWTKFYQHTRDPTTQVYGVFVNFFFFFNGESALPPPPTSSPPPPPIRGNFTSPTKRSGVTLENLLPVYDPFPTSGEFILPTAVMTQACGVFLWCRSFFLRWITADPSPRGNFTPPTKHECGETLGDLEPVYHLFTSVFTQSKVVSQTHSIHCKAGGFSYSESPWTPPLEGTSLHRRNSVERPWGILSLFTSKFTLPETVTQVAYAQINTMPDTVV